MARRTGPQRPGLVFGLGFALVFGFGVGLAFGFGVARPFGGVFAFGFAFAFTFGLVLPLALPADVALVFGLAFALAPGRFAVVGVASASGGGGPRHTTSPARSLVNNALRTSPLSSPSPRSRARCSTAPS